MRSRQRVEPAPRTPSFALANEVLMIYAEGAKTYWRMWGPLGLPAIHAVETWTRLQRSYLETLENIVVPTGSSLTPSDGTENGRLTEALRDLFTNLGIGFDD